MNNRELLGKMLLEEKYPVDGIVAMLYTMMKNVGRTFKDYEVNYFKS